MVKKSINFAEIANNYVILTILETFGGFYTLSGLFFDQLFFIMRLIRYIMTFSLFNVIMKL